MAEITKVPTQEVIFRARERGMKPRDFIYYQTIILRNQDGDTRTRNKNGIILEDYMITRDDGTRIIIHEERSEVKQCQKIVLMELDQNNSIIKTYNAYTDNIDFSKMERDKNYLNCLGNELLEQRRLIGKEQIAKNMGINDAIYIGTVGLNGITYKYEKQARNSEVALDQIRSGRKIEKERKAKNERDFRDRVRKMHKIAKIKEKLHPEKVSEDDLNRICEILGIIRKSGHGEYDD